MNVTETKKETPIYLVRVREYSDGRKMLSLHGHFKPRPKAYLKTIIENKSNKHESYKRMTTRCYVRTLKETHKKLFNREYNLSNCFNVTLTTEKYLSLDDLNESFKNFIGALEYHYGNVEYVRAIEHHKFIPNYHIHAILQFDEFPFIRQEDVNRIWKHGISQLKKTYDIYGAIQYITKFKKQQLYPKREIYKNNKPEIIYDEYHVAFPPKTRLITTSQHFGTECTTTQYREYAITKKEVKDLADEARKKGLFIRKEVHFYGYDHAQVAEKKKAKLPYCLDKMFIPSDMTILCRHT